LIDYYTIAGDAVLNASAMESTLATVRNQAAEATLRAAQAEAEKAKAQKVVHKQAIYTSNDKFDDFIYGSESNTTTGRYSGRTASTYEN